MKIRRKPACHPERKHYAKGLCRQCYNAGRPTRRKNTSPDTKTKKYARARNARLRQTYGISSTEYDEMSKQQNHTCMICGESEKKQTLTVDHDHKTGKIRSLLCINCNSGIGRFNDDPALLIVAAEYLIRHRRNETQELIENLSKANTSDFKLPSWADDARA